MKPLFCTAGCIALLLTAFVLLYPKESPEVYHNNIMSTQILQTGTVFLPGTEGLASSAGAHTTTAGQESGDEASPTPGNTATAVQESEDEASPTPGNTTTAVQESGDEASPTPGNTATAGQENAASSVSESMISSVPETNATSAQERSLFLRRAAVAAKNALPTAAPATLSFDDSIRLRVLTPEGTKTLRLRDYLLGVLLAELPENFPTEAQKAQAVAARTFVLRKAQEAKHPYAHVCTDSACCQGWQDPSEVCPQTVAVLDLALRETDGLVLFYEDSLIDATFFSCSGGKTEDAAAVWGSHIPYLCSVSSPGEEAAPFFSDSSYYTAEEFSRILRSAYPEANLSGEPTSWFGPVRYTEGGGIDTAFIGGVAVSGVRLRQLFSLRSTRISFGATEQGVAIAVSGYGHRVGLSQYGAAAMARRGSDFEEILLHYYSGVEIKRLRNAAA